MAGPVAVGILPAPDRAAMTVVAGGRASGLADDAIYCAATRRR
jgi:hypothetical protein